TVDRGGRLDLDHTSELLVAVEDQIRKMGTGRNLDRGVLLVAGIGHDLVVILVVLPLQEVDQTIVLGLLPFRSNRNGHTTSLLGYTPEHPAGGPFLTIATRS